MTDPLDVLLDLTPLDTPQRFRGIGRYTSALAAAISALPAPPRAGLSIAGLTTVHPWATQAVDPTLRYAGDPTRAFDVLSYRTYRAKKWLLLGTAAARTHARLLHVTDPVAVPVRRLRPTVVTAYDLIPFVLQETFLSRRPAARRLRAFTDGLRYRRATRCLAISEATKRDLVHHVGVDPARIDVTLLGVHHATYHAGAADGERVRVYTALGVERPFLFYLGAAEARKNVDLLVTAYARSRLGPDVPLVLAGMHGRRRGRALRALVERLGIARSVHFPGYLPEDVVPAAYRACLAHVFPSRYEGFGLPVLEALACGAPTIVTAVSSLAEVAGDAALTIAADDADDLTGALRRVVEDDALRADLARRGPPWAQTFTWERCARQTVASYVRALACPST